MSSARDLLLIKQFSVGKESVLTNFFEHSQGRTRFVSRSESAEISGNPLFSQRKGRGARVTKEGLSFSGIFGVLMDHLCEFRSLMSPCEEKFNRKSAGSYDVTGDVTREAFS